MNRTLGILLCAVLTFPAAQGSGLRAAQTNDGPPADASSQSPSSSAPLFKSNTDLVILRVNVFDGRSDAVAALPQTAFSVVEPPLTYQKADALQAVEPSFRSVPK